MTRPSQELEMTEFLIAIAALDRCEQHIAPKDDVAKRIELEIEKKSGAKSSLLSQQPCETESVLISAEPSRFVTETSIALENFAKLLKVNNAKEFEVAFHNTTIGKNAWGDKVKFGVRYKK